MMGSIAEMFGLDPVSNAKRGLRNLDHDFGETNVLRLKQKRDAHEGQQIVNGFRPPIDPVVLEVLLQAIMSKR